MEQKKKSDKSTLKKNVFLATFFFKYGREKLLMSQNKYTIIYIRREWGFPNQLKSIP